MGAYFSRLFNASPEPGFLRSGVNTRAELVARIRGSRVRIPDLQGLFTHWPQHVHPEVEKLDEHVQRTLESIFPEPQEEQRLRKMKATEVALFAASWWAYAPFEMLCVATTLSIWLFVWDDELDSTEFSSLIDDFKSASEFRKETIKFIRASLSRNQSSDNLMLTNNRIITCFKPVGDAITAAYNDRQIDTFLKELMFFVDMCQEEHKFQMTADMPTPEQYIQRRMGSGAVRVCLAINEYTTGITLPEEIINSGPIQTIWHETNIIICCINDLLSAQSQADTLVPLLFLKLKSVQAAIDEAALMVSRSIDRLDAAENEILAQYSTSPKTQDMIQTHIDACKFACTANLNWRQLDFRTVSTSLYFYG
ncbi:hypothetical protein GQX73_g8904 [Xylaria multiplex]|uniref:Terpene synthase n=1 Tax=Xylaria multiplex TaxID=323545 RepID=A0A7C8IMD1_9PEZI|nr:hypothetical protein GQX73_g8904 [Xylaria multiplex]